MKFFIYTTKPHKTKKTKQKLKMIQIGNLSSLVGGASTGVYEFMKGRLYFTSFNGEAPQRSNDMHYFSVDQQLVYCHFYNDFGPNNLAHVWRFNAMLKNKLASPELAGKKICLYTNMANDKRANGAFMLCAFMMLEQKQTAEEAFQPLQSVRPPFLPYRDAGYGPATYHITVLDCLQGLQHAIKTNLFKPEEFNLAEYEYFEKVENGDMNWLMPNKFLAFATPHDETSEEYERVFHPYSSPRPKIDQIIAYFKKMNITTVVRLNNATYDRTKFIKAGIEHVDMYFPDGSVPSDSILYSFIELAEKRQGRIAVHCKAGLGRTGTLIAAFMMKHYSFTAPEIIAWLRLSRPGCVVGPQQNYVQSIQPTLWKAGPNTRRLSADSLTEKTSKISKRKSAQYIAVEEISVEPTSQVAATTVVGEQEFAVPVQPRKENMNMIIQDVKKMSVLGNEAMATNDGSYVIEGDANNNSGYNLRSKTAVMATGGHEKRSIVKAAMRKSFETLQNLGK